MVTLLLFHYARCSAPEYPTPPTKTAEWKSQLPPLIVESSEAAGAPGDVEFPGDFDFLGGGHAAGSDLQSGRREEERYEGDREVTVTDSDC